MKNGIQPNTSIYLHLPSGRTLVNMEKFAGLVKRRLGYASLESGLGESPGRKPKEIRLFVFLLFLLFSGKLPIMSQTVQSGSTDHWQRGVENKIEIQADNESVAGEYSGIGDELNELSEQAVNLNNASRQELERIPFLDDLLIYNLIAYRETVGHLVSIYELQAIDGFDYVLIRNVQAFVTVEPVKKEETLKAENVVRYGKHQLLFRMERFAESRKGYSLKDDSLFLSNPSGGYLGSPNRFILKYSFRYKNKVRMGMIAEKDPGEPFFIKDPDDPMGSNLSAGRIQGFDYYSFHLLLSLSPTVKTIVIGDYQLKFGQGLTLWSGYAFGKTSGATGIKKMAAGLKPHTGTDENRFFRGAATTLVFGDLKTTLFISSNTLDATIAENDSQGWESGFANPIFTGYHRTLAEISKKNALNILMGGGNICYANHRFNLGLTVHNTSFEYPRQLSGQLYKAFEYSGKQHFNAGIDYHILLKGINIFGEVSMSQNGSYAMIHGLSTVLHPRLSISLLYRSYHRSYFNFFCNPIAERSYNNEKGFYTGLKMQIHSKILLNCYLDAFSFPWLTFRTDKPTEGMEFLLDVDYKLNASVVLSGAMKIKKRQYNFSDNAAPMHSLANFGKRNVRFQIDYHFSSTLRMRDRLEFSRTSNPGNILRTGFLVYHDIKWMTKKEHLSVNFRYAVFDTDTYEERIYAYEHDVLYSFSVPAYYYKGIKGVLLVRYRINNPLSVWFRISRTWYSNIDTIGSGLDEVKGNSLTYFKVQFQMKIG